MEGLVERHRRKKKGGGDGRAEKGGRSDDATRRKANRLDSDLPADAHGCQTPPRRGSTGYSLQKRIGVVANNAIWCSGSGPQSLSQSHGICTSSGRLLGSFVGLHLFMSNASPFDAFLDRYGRRYVLLLSLLLRCRRS